MKAPHLFSWLFIVLVSLTICTAPLLAQDDCANLPKLKLYNVTITSAVFINDPKSVQPAPDSCENYNKWPAWVYPGATIYNGSSGFIDTAKLPLRQTDLVKPGLKFGDY